jgi:hypothetical protein
MIDLLHGVYPAPGRRVRGTRDKKPWASCYLYEARSGMLDEGGYDVFPFTVPRWTKASGEVHGRGPGHYRPARTSRR